MIFDALKQLGDLTKMVSLEGQIFGKTLHNPS